MFDHCLKFYFKSFLCTAGFDISLRQSDGDYTVRFNLKRLQLQPFKVPEDTFANPVICQQGIFNQTLQLKIFREVNSLQNCLYFFSQKLFRHFRRCSRYRWFNSRFTGGYSSG